MSDTITRNLEQNLEVIKQTQEIQNTQRKINIEQTSEIDPYKVEIKTDKLIEFIIGLQPNPEKLPKILEIFEKDQKIVRSKYGLPPLEMIRNDPREYELRLRKIAKKLGITILSTISCGSFFDEAFASAVFISGLEGGSKKIGIDINEESLETYTRSLLTLEHEIIHAYQNDRYLSMPIEIQEYEAYIANTNIKYLKENPEAVKDFFDFFVGASVRIFYRLSNEDAKKRGLPPIKPSY